MTQTQKFVTLRPNPEENFSLVDLTASTNSTQKIKEKLTEMNKTIFRSKLIPDKIQKLERDALRGEGASIPEGKPCQRVKKSQDFLTLIIKSEHKSGADGTKIIKLPKLPFGQHRSYNEEPQFRDKHFLEGNILEGNTERLKDLENITRKFRLHEKKFKANKKSRQSSAKPLLTNFSNYDVYDMGPGTLVCEKREDVIDGYERNNVEIKDMSKTYSKCIEKNGYKDSPIAKYLLRKTLDFKKEQSLVTRLLPAPENKDSKMSLFFTTKYSALFENSAQDSLILQNNKKASFS